MKATECNKIISSEKKSNWYSGVVYTGQYCTAVPLGATSPSTSWRSLAKGLTASPSTLMSGTSASSWPVGQTSSALTYPFCCPPLLPSDWSPLAAAASIRAFVAAGRSFTLSAERPLNGDSVGVSRDWGLGVRVWASSISAYE